MRTWYKYRLTTDPALASRDVDTDDEDFIELNRELSPEDFLAHTRKSPTTRAIIDFLHRAAQPEERILSIGGGNGEHEIHLIREGYDITVSDISEEALQVLAEKFPGTKTLKLDILRDDFDTACRDLIGTFDATFVPSIFYYMDAENTARLIRNMAALVRPGGRMLITFRSRDSWLTRFLDNHLVRWEQALLRWNRRRKTGVPHYTYRSAGGYRRTLEEMRAAVETHSTCRFRSLTFGAFEQDLHRSAILQKTGLNVVLGAVLRRHAAYANCFEFVKPEAGSSS